MDHVTCIDQSDGYKSLNGKKHIWGALYFEAIFELFSASFHIWQQFGGRNRKRGWQALDLRDQWLCGD